MRPTKIIIPPPRNFETYGPSELFRFFFQIGHWTEDSFSEEFQNYTRGTLISTVTINKWKNKNVIPTRYSGQLFKMIETLSEPPIGKAWIKAFETVWALHAAGRYADIESTSERAPSDTVCRQHRKWIQHLYTQPMEGQSFSTADIYVPLQCLNASEDSGEILDVEDAAQARSKMWTFISGGPGSGKSISALRLARSFCEGDVFPIYIRGKHVSDIDIDVTNSTQFIFDSFSIKSFLKQFRASSFDSACLILDGLDEINQMSGGRHNRVAQILSNLKLEQAACAAHGKSLQFVVFGREPHIEYAASLVQDSQSQHLTLLSLDGSHPSKEKLNDSKTGSDLRPIWWEKYLEATQRNIDPTLPDFLCLEYDDFSSFGLNPLLSFLMCQTAFEHAQDSAFVKSPHVKLQHEYINAFTYRSNKNEIYNSIVQHMAGSLSHILTPPKFRAVLQHIAVSIWQAGDNLSVPINHIYDSLEDADQKRSFKALGLDSRTPTPPDIFVTSFYYRVTPHENQPENMRVEFTDETFSDYLVSTFLFDRFVDLLSAFKTNEKTEEALSAWARASSSGAHTPSLAGFCQKEAILRYDDFADLNWDFALKIIQSHLSPHHLGEGSLKSLTQLQHSNSVLFFIWSCLNLERYKRRDTHFDIIGNTQDFDINTLRVIQSPHSASHQSSPFNKHAANHHSFLSFSLSGQKVSAGDMRQFNFRQGHMEHAIYIDTNFAMTHWSHVKVSDSQFSRATFQQAIIHKWRVIKSDFKNCLFQGSRFEGALFNTCQMRDVFFSQCHFSEVEFMAPQFKNVIFDRCVFSDVSFSQLDDRIGLTGAKFRYCTFLDMEANIEKIPIDNLIGTIQKNPDGTTPIALKTSKIGTALQKFL